MGRTTNSNIFRLGIKKTEWDSKYFEKNKEEFTLYNYQNLHIRYYLEQFFNSQGLIIKSLNIYFNNNHLHIFISYFNVKKSFLSLNTTPTSQFIQFQNKISNKSAYFIKTKLKHAVSHKVCNNKNLLYKKTFLQQLLETLSMFKSKNSHIFLTLQNFNKGLNLQLSQEEKKYFKNKILLLKRYSKNDFFKECLNITLIITRIKNCATVLTQFVAKQLCALKRHNYFLIFLKKILTIFIFSKFSKLEGVKLVINGKFNGAPRAKNKLILIGNVPIQSINKQIDYFDSISFTKNGTFGIKAWLKQKNL